MLAPLNIPRHWTPPLQRLCREAPWLAAVAISSAMLLDAIPKLNHPWGSNWPMYFESARFFWDPTAAYFGWRPPLYPLILATLGNAVGYVKAAHWIAQISMVLTVLFCGTTARLMAGVAPAVIAVLSIPMLQCAVEGAMWTNMYPPAAAAMSLSSAIAVALWRRPSLALAVAAGLAAGFAWRINHLGLVAIPLGLGMAVLAAHSVRRLVVLPLLFGFGVSGAVTVDQWVVERWNVPQEELSVQVLQRRREELDRIASGQASKEQFSACTNFDPKPLNIDELLHPCAQQFVAANYGTLQAEDCVPNITTLIWMLPLCLLPSARRRSWKDTAASILLFGGPMGAFLIASAWTSYAEKYIISFLFMMVLIVPMAFERLGGWAGWCFDRIQMGRLVGAIFAGLWVAYGWPGFSTFKADPPNIQRDWESVSGEISSWAQTSLGDNDLLLDCVPLHVGLVILPKTANIKEGVSTEKTCLDWQRNPPASDGRTYLVQQAFPRQPETQPAHLQSLGWSLVRAIDDRHRLWMKP